jgi:Sulfotransferase family
MAEPVRVLYVMGHGWSGSTILGNLLGELDGFFHAGELRRLWGEALPSGAPCGCGRPIGECPVWSKVVAHPAVSGLDPVQVDRWHLRSTPVRRTLSLLRRRPDRGPTQGPAQDESHFESSLDRDLAGYLNAAERLYRAVAEVMEARVIVDTSKRAGDAAALLLMPGVDPFFVHLIRDPRGVAYSWARRKEPGHGPAATARDWMAFNLLDEAIRRRAGKGRSVRIRYEDLVNDPADALRSATRLMGEHVDEFPVRSGREALLRVNHGVMGNPSRFVTGEVQLREDKEWKGALSRGRRAAVTALTAPLLARYGYSLLGR